MALRRAVPGVAARQLLLGGTDGDGTLLRPPDHDLALLQYDLYPALPFALEPGPDAPGASLGAAARRAIARLLRALPGLLRLWARSAAGLCAVPDLVVPPRHRLEPVGHAVQSAPAPRAVRHPGERLSRLLQWQRHNLASLVPQGLASGRQRLDPLLHGAAGCHALHQRDPPQAVDRKRAPDLPHHTASTPDLQRPGVPGRRAVS